MVGCSYVDKIGREHGQMLVEEVDATLVDTLGDGLADLMGTPALNHIKSRPAVLGLSSGRGSDKKAVLELSLQVVLFDVVGEEGGHLPVDGWLAM